MGEACLVAQYVVQQWQNSWASCSNGRQYRKIEPDVWRRVKYACNTRRKEVTATRLRRGKCLLNPYLYEIHAHPDGLCELCRQEAQLSQRDRATLRVIEYFAKSLKIIRNDCWVGRKSLLVCHWNYTCIRCTVSKIFSVKEWRDLENGGSGLSRSLKMAPFDRSYTTLYWSAILSMLYHFRVIWRWIIVTLKMSLKVIQTGTIRKLGCGFLFTFHSNYGRIFNRLWDI